MTQLTKEHFEQQLQQQTKELKDYTDQQTETLAKAVNNAFEHHRKGYLQEQFDRLEDTSDLRLQVKR